MLVVAQLRRFKSLLAIALLLLGEEISLHIEKLLVAPIRWRNIGRLFEPPSEHVPDTAVRAEHAVIDLAALVNTGVLFAEDEPEPLYLAVARRSLARSYQNHVTDWFSLE
jgi:hypothetical protein